jgi:hypothetical protein
VAAARADGATRLLLLLLRLLLAAACGMGAVAEAGGWGSSAAQPAAPTCGTQALVLVLDWAVM